jgi:beta-lactam-binding protein with PASTA domain
VPPVEGAATEEAIATLQAAGFGVQQFETPAQPGETPGTVVAQDPPPGTELPLGSTVTIWVAVESELPTPEPTDGPDPGPTPTVDPSVPPGPPPSSNS